jgi:hypothetical protein
MIHPVTSHSSVAVTMGHLSTLILPATRTTDVYMLSFVSRNYVLGLDDPLVSTAGRQSYVAVCWKMVPTSLHFTPATSWPVDLLGTPDMSRVDLRGGVSIGKYVHGHAPDSN